MTKEILSNRIVSLSYPDTHFAGIAFLPLHVPANFAPGS
jgi:hypothetical protein